MAKLGEGDPRWIVRERDDGRNVNNWHWTEHDASEWSKRRLCEMLQNLKIPLFDYKDDGCNDDVVVLVKDVEKVDGDATLYNRKGCLKIVYDLKAEGKWITRYENNEKVEECENEENRKRKKGGEGAWRFELFDNEPEVLVSIQNDGGMNGLKSFVGKVLGRKVRDIAQVFLKELQEGGDVELKGVNFAEGKKKQEEISVHDFPRTITEKKSTGGKVVTREKTTEDLKLKDVFLCSRDDLFLALTEEKRIEGYTRAKAKSDPKKGGILELRNRTVTATYEDIDPGKQIVLRWRMSKWPEDAENSIAIIKIQEVEGKSELVLEQTGIPIKWKSETEGFWRVQIFQAIKVIMGYGSASFL